MLAKAVLLVALATVVLVASADDHVIGGAFTAVDSVPSTGFAAFRHPGAAAGTDGDSKRYPNGQFLLPMGTAPGFVSGTSMRAYAQDGSVVGANVGAAPALASNSELWMLQNATSQFVRRLFGFNGFFGFDNGQPSGQPNPRGSANYVGLIQNLAFLGAAPSRRLVVCMGNNAATVRLLVGNTSLPNPSTRNPTPTNLANQLLLFTEGGSSSFLSTGFVVNTPVSATPTTITPRYSPANSDSQPGVDCSSMVAGGKTVIIAIPTGPYYMTNDVGSVSPTTWSQITRDPLKSGSAGPLSSPFLSVSNADPFYLLGAEQGNPTVYWYGANPSDTTLTTDDQFNTFYKYTAGTSWSPIVPVSIIKNVTAVDYVVGNGGDSEIYFTLAPSDQDSVPSFIDDVRMPVEQYVFLGGPSGFNYIAPLWQLSRTGAINLHYDINLKSLVVFSTDLSGAVVGNRLTYKVPEDDRRYFSKSFAFVARYDSAGSRWVQAYGGGFDGAVGRIVSTTNGVTYFEGGFKYAFQRATGPMAMYNPTLGVWDYSYGAAFERVDIDGGDMRGIFNSGPSVYDVQRMNFLGNDGFIVAGSFRTSDDGTVPCNSICFFPKNNGAKLALFDSPSSSFYNNSGVRMADPASASAIIPEHADSVPGLITNVVVDGGSIFVGGTFQIAGDKAASNFAVFTVSSSKFSNGWSNALGGVDGPVWSMVKFGNAIIIGGSFQTVGSTIKAQNIAGFDLTTRTWFTLNRGLDGTVYKLVPYDGKLLAVGTFASGSGQTLGFAGLWDGKKWAPMTTDAKFPKNNCLYTYCLLSEIPSASGAYDAFVYGKTPYFVLATGSGVRLVRFETKYDGFMTVDGNAFQGAVATFTNGFSVPTGASYFAGSPLGGRRFDLWNVEQAGQAGQLQSKGVSCYNVGYDNFENNGNTGTNGLVYIALPENKVSMSAALVASMALVFAALAVLLF